jgi:hypothetical protein
MCGGDKVCASFLEEKRDVMAESWAAGTSPDQYCADLGFCTYNASCIVR